MTGYNKFLYDTWKEAPAVTGVASMDKTGKTGELTALDELTFSVREGEILGLI